MSRAEIKVLPLGAGRDVGRSCILVQLADKTVMLDCGLHMGFNNDKKFPDFDAVTGGRPLDDFVDCVLISHFHLDHCGALPYMSEIVGYTGPIIMSAPSRSIIPLLLEDFRRVSDKHSGSFDMYSSDQIEACMSKVTVIQLNQTLEVVPGLFVKAYYAGHVLGAVMFHVAVNLCSLSSVNCLSGGGEFSANKIAFTQENFSTLSVVYTGDFSTSSDSHLGAAWIDRCTPDVLISESTYATTIRESRKCREIDFLRKVHQIVDNGGKVLIPAFALGRAQELCLLLENYWERMGLHKNVPIYYSSLMSSRSLYFYRLFISWTNEYMKGSFYRRNSFEFKHIQQMDRKNMHKITSDESGPAVILSSPGMLHAGTSLEIFKLIAENSKNAVIIPGYCVKGTVGDKILNGCKVISFNDKKVNINLQIYNMSFSAHADANGIMQIVEYCRPKSSVVFVHGEGDKMDFLAEKIKLEFDLDSYCPENGQCVLVNNNKRLLFNNEYIDVITNNDLLKNSVCLGNKRLSGVISINKVYDTVKFFSMKEINKKYHVKPLKFKYVVEFGSGFKESQLSQEDNVKLRKYLFGKISQHLLQARLLPNKMIFPEIKKNEKMHFDSIRLKLVSLDNSSLYQGIRVEWDHVDVDLACDLIDSLRRLVNI